MAYVVEERFPELSGSRTFEFTFIRRNETEFYVYDPSDLRAVLKLDAESYDPIKCTNLDRGTDLGIDESCIEQRIIAEFNTYKETRPEFLVGLPSNRQKGTINGYLDLLLGTVLLSSSNTDLGVVRFNRILQWLNEGDFFTAPASTRYHDAFTGGLLTHTLNVYDNMVELSKIDKFASVKVKDYALVALVHDWCKIGLYEVYMKNVKDDTTGKWYQQEAFRWRDEGPSFALGHGVSSMFLASRFLPLNLEQSAAIRWHMGSYRCVDEEFSELQKCNETYPIVHMLQFADQLSIVRY